MLHEDMLAREDIDAVYAPLPSGMRNEYMSRAVAAGKHVYSEKPMGGTVQEVAELTQACAAAGVQWMDGTMWYHSHRTLAIEEKLRRGDLGKIDHVSAAFTFKAPDEAWLNGGNGRTDKTREPMGCLGDQGWYPLSAILWAYDWELPERVMATSTTLNTVDTVVACSGTLFFSGGRIGTFDCGCTRAHRSQVEIVGETGTIRVDDLVGGQGRSGDFAAYETPFVGSSSYVQGDVMGKDEVVQVEPCDHVNALTAAFARCVSAVKAGGEPDADWPRRSLAVHTVMSAVFESASARGTMVPVGH
jgi:predicted dehydrogenase